MKIDEEAGVRQVTLDTRALFVLGLLGFVVAALPHATAATAQGEQWTMLSPNTAPMARNLHGMAFDTARARVVLFGGVTYDDDFRTYWSNDTWEWDGADWLRRTPQEKPPTLAGHAVAYDEERERVVLFGGYERSGGPSVAGTWEWDGTDWTALKPATEPPARDHHGMAYDPDRGTVVLFGGTVANSQTELLDDTWEWDGSEWTNVTPPISPLPRREPVMTASPDGEGILLFGGVTGPYGEATSYMADTWMWDGETWTELSPPQSPPPRARHAMALDTLRERVILFGGYGPVHRHLSDTWEWDGSTWTSVQDATGPSPRNAHAMAFDAERANVVLFGGLGPAAALSDTWVYGIQPTATPVVSPTSVILTPTVTATDEPTAVTPDSYAYLPLTVHAIAADQLPEPEVDSDYCARLHAGPPGRLEQATGTYTAVHDLSAAHNAIRMFGTSDRYATVDQALVSAFRAIEGAKWPDSEPARFAFLKAYASELNGVCVATAAQDTLGPASVELYDGVAVIKPGTGDVTVPAASAGVALDLRFVPNVPEADLALDKAVAAVLHRPLQRPIRVVRFHNGLTDEVVSARNVYGNTSGPLSTAPIMGTAAVERPLAVLTGERMSPAAAELAGTLRMGNRASMVGNDILAAVAESRWSGVGQHGIAWRGADYRHVDAPEPPIQYEDMEVRQDDCTDYATASVKRDFTTTVSTALVTATMTGTTGAASETNLDLLLMYDRNGDGHFDVDTWEDVVAFNANATSNETITTEELLPPGHFQVWVHGCSVPSPPAMADVSIEYNPGHRWPDVVRADIHTVHPLARLGDAMDEWYRLTDFGPGSAERAHVQGIAPFADIQPEGAGPAEQRAALVILHGVYRRFYPYFEVVGDTIDERLLETLSYEPPDGHPRRAMSATLRRFAASIHDGHSTFRNYGASLGHFNVSIRLERVGEQPVVRASAYDEIRPGHTLVAIDGRPAADAYADEYRRTMASTDGYRFIRASHSLMRAHGEMTLEFRDEAGVTYAVTVTGTGSTSLGPTYGRPSGWLADIDAPRYYYMNLDTAVMPNMRTFRAALGEAMTAEGMVVDMRGYPGGVNHSEVARRMMTTTVASAIFGRRTYAGPDRVHEWDSQYNLSPLSAPHYHGTIALLVGPNTISAAEDFAMMLVAANRATVVGRQSAGTNGNVTGVQLPGAFGGTFTGMEVLYPDRSTFHGVGILPDIHAAPSATDLRNGIDRELIVAAEYLQQQ